MHTFRHAKFDSFTDSRMHLLYFLLFLSSSHKLSVLFYWDVYPPALFIDLKENSPVGSWNRSEVSRAQTERINRKLCAECFFSLEKRRLWSFSTRKVFEALMCSVGEWPFDLLVKSVLLVVASTDRQVCPQKLLPLCLADPTPLLSALE